ncbi:MCE family protein [Nocardioides speluncae]|uniref:MCE family protein n=1 Tax=Nocardioides speluncae TaxID=2670337 RepID=UPI000D697CA5|nr:MlaD family protein [Nocardioides speluncae]
MTGLRATLVKFTLFATIAVLLFGVLWTTMSNTVPGDKRTWTARFTAVAGLRSGDDVRVAGVKVGRVEKIEVVDNDQALVTFTLLEDQHVYEKTQVSLRYQNLLGQRYLALTAGKDRGNRLTPGTEIPASMTDAGFDLTALLNGFEPLFNVIEPAEVNKLAANLIAVLQGESGTVESLLRQTARATTYLASKDEVFSEVLTNLTPVLRNLDANSGEFDAAVVQLKKLVTGLAKERKTFASSIDNIGGLLESTAGLLDRTRTPIAKDIKSLRRLNSTFTRGQEEFGVMIGKLPLLLEAFSRAMGYGGFANVYVCELGVDVAGGEIWLSPEGAAHSGACR